MNINNSYPFLFVGQGMSNPNSQDVENAHDVSYTLVFFEVLKKNIVKEILKIGPEIIVDLRPSRFSEHWYEGSNMISVTLSHYRIMKLLKEKWTSDAKWSSFQENLETWLHKVHAIQPIAFIFTIYECPEDTNRISYGKWHIWSVLEQGPELLWPLIYQLWNNKFNKNKNLSSNQLPITFEKFKYKNAIDELYKEDWTGEETGSAIKEQMYLMLYQAIKFWEKEIKKLPKTKAELYKKKITSQAKKMITGLKKWYSANT